MSYVVLHRESNNFKDVLSDPVVRKAIRTKLQFLEHLILELADDKDTSYLMLKYGTDIINMTDISPDRSPVPYKDYIPEQKKGKIKILSS